MTDGRAAPPRLVSLVPAATETVAALGAASWLVGISHACDFPPQVAALPRVTRAAGDRHAPSAAIDRWIAGGATAVTLDAALVRRLAPDLVLTQSVCAVCAVGSDALGPALAALPHAPATVTLHAHDLAGVLADMQRVGDALGLPAAAAALTAGLRRRLQRVRERGVPHPTSPRARVLVLEWLDPPFTAGHWVPELVVAAGGIDVGERPGARSRRRTWPELRALAPDVVVVACCGFDVARARREAAAVADPAGRALLDGRVAFLDGNAYTSRPGPRLAEAAERLAPLIRG